MTTFPADLLTYSQNKTRVLIYTSQPAVSQLTVQVLEFYHKDFDFFSNNGFYKREDHDFVVFETSRLEEAAAFKPNIVLVSDEIDLQTADGLLQNITPGGVLIYSEKFDNVVESSTNFFRKLPFALSNFQKDNTQITLSTEMGSIPLTSGNEDLIRNLDGIKLLCQQFGIMEEEFYEPVMSFA